VQTLCLEWVHSLRVSNICFLFHFCAIARGSFDCGGIKNAFYIRMKEESNKHNMRYLQVQEQEHVSFYSCYGMTYSERIWCSLKTIQDSCKKIFCRLAAGQGLNEKIILQNVTAEFWSYFTFNLSGSNVNIKVSEGSHHVCWSNLSLETKSVTRVHHCIRIITSNHLASLRSVLGSRFGIGVKKRFPPRGERERHCLRGDDINLIVIDEKKNTEMGYRKGKRYLLRINERGFDFNFEPSNNSLIIQCRFNSVRASDKMVSDFIAFRNSQENLVSELVPVGLTFYYEGELVKVVETTSVQTANINLRINLSQEMVKGLLIQQST